MSAATEDVAASPSRTEGYAIGIDIGGTKVAGGLVDSDGRIVRRVRRGTPPHDPGGVEATVLAVARELAAAPGVVAVGVGAPGVVDETGSVVRFAANLGWREVPLRARLEEVTGLPTAVENDANAAAGARCASERPSASPTWPSSASAPGIGGGIVLGGELYRGHSGMAVGVRPRPGRPRRPAVRLRPARVLGAVRLRLRAGPGGAGASP